MKLRSPTLQVGSLPTEPPGKPIYIMEYYSTIKKNENVPLTAAWMNLKGIILSEISQTEEDKYMILLTRAI